MSRHKTTAYLQLGVQLRVQRRGEQVVQLPQNRAHALGVRGGQRPPTALHMRHMRVRLGSDQWHHGKRFFIQ